MLKKMLIYILFFVLGAIFMGIILVFYYNPNIPATLNTNHTIAKYLEYGDSFKEIEIRDYNNQLSDLNLGNDYTIIFHLSASCHSCIDKIDGFKNLINSFSSSQLEFRFLWTDEIPKQVISEYGISDLLNYSLNGKYTLSDIFPEAYILDNDGKIIFKCNSMENLVNKMVEIFQEKVADIRNSAIKYFFNTFKDQNSYKLVIFTTGNCEGCEIVDNKIKKNKLDNTQIIKISDESQTDQNIYQDYFSLYTKLFNIKKYPSLYLYNSDGNFILHTSDINEIYNYLAKGS